MLDRAAQVLVGRDSLGLPYEIEHQAVAGYWRGRLYEVEDLSAEQKKG